MSVWRAILCVVFPPLAVLDKGCGMASIVGLLWIFGWLPGVIAAIAINMMNPQALPNTRPGFVEVPVYREDNMIEEKPKRKGAYIRLSDGETAEVIEDDGEIPEQRKRNEW
jgi:uncharacterized membrane protein YqaE (UPF0057 family)